MPKVTVILLSEAERTVLEKASKYGATPSFRLRCRAVLLKTEKRSALEVALQLGCCEMSVNDWLKRYQEQGFAGLQVQKGRGRKSILNQETDLDAVRHAVQHSRQRVSLAKAELERELGKEFSQLTLRRFLKKMVAATNAFDEK